MTTKEENDVSLLDAFSLNSDFLDDLAQEEEHRNGSASTPTLVIVDTAEMVQGENDTANKNTGTTEEEPAMDSNYAPIHASIVEASQDEEDTTDETTKMRTEESHKVESATANAMQSKDEVLGPDNIDIVINVRKQEAVRRRLVTDSGESTESAILKKPKTAALNGGEWSEAIKDQDVLIDKNDKYHNHVGNQWFCNEVNKPLRNEYKRAPPDKKLKISQSLVEALHENGGRFLENVAEEGEPPSWRRVIPIEPRSRDVLFGRGGLSNNNEGNQAYRESVAFRALEYRRADDTDKRMIAKNLIAFIRNGDHMDEAVGEHDDTSRRFLENIFESIATKGILPVWREVADDEQLVQKVMRALRPP